MIPGMQEFSRMVVLGALQSRPMYEGSVSPETKAKRRAANRVARRSRRVNRARSG